MIVPVRKHKHTYKIIGTGHMSGGLLGKLCECSFVMCDLMCDKCGRTKTVYVYDDYYEKRIMCLASEDRYFDIPEDQLISEKQFQAYLDRSERIMKQ